MEVSAEEYHSSDFQWEDLKNRIESDPSLHYHILPFQSSQHHQLKPEARQKKVQDLLTEDSEAWQTFHTRHSSGKFFKERRYLLKEFPELVACGEYSKLLEVGCGNGSSVLPILRGNKNMVIYACDCSTEALERTEESIRAANLISDCFRTFCCDFSTTGFSSGWPCNP
ncbi:methyltransferase-like protein 6, partial [Carica papaya]|uniref:methyltransferase-like protein 6 n=1 Tax=Carica papaya TaxID=3649 RepID=UPI000B8CFED8